MSAFGALDRGTRVAILLAAAALILGAGYLGWQMTRPVPPAEIAAPVAATGAEAALSVETTAAEPATETAAPEPAALEPAAPETAASTTEPLQPTSDPAETAPVAQPVIDTWRVTAEGDAIVSGKPNLAP